MAKEKRPKWDIGATIEAALKTYKLANTYRSNLENRLQPDELETLKAGGDELSLRHSGQAEKLSDQKSKTRGQDEVIQLINARVVSIRNIVQKSSESTAEIRKAYGVGERITKTVDSIKAAANIVVNAYNNHTGWSNKAGIIDADITELNSLSSDLTQANLNKSDSMIARKMGTLDKVILQRTVEDLISKISALGSHVFGVENPPLAKLFDDLTPNSGNGKPSNGDTKPDTNKP